MARVKQGRDLYATLGVKQKASQVEISRQFKKLAKKYHPDLRPGDKRAEERFKEITAAYEVLGDPKARDRYDTDIRFSHTPSATVASSGPRPEKYPTTEHYRQHLFKRAYFVRLGVGFGLMLIGLILVMRSNVFNTSVAVSRAQDVQATVVSLPESPSEKALTYTLNGQSLSATLPNQYESRGVGDVVDIYVDPDEPTDVHPGRKSGTFSPTLAIVATLAFAGGFALLPFHRYRWVRQ